MSKSVSFTVPAISCDHCQRSIRDEVCKVAGVADVDVDLETKVVTVRGRELDAGALRAAIREAGYEAR